MEMCLKPQAIPVSFVAGQTVLLRFFFSQAFTAIYPYNRIQSIKKIKPWNTTLLPYFACVLSTSFNPAFRGFMRINHALNSATII